MKCVNDVEEEENKRENMKWRVLNDHEIVIETDFHAK